MQVEKTYTVPRKNVHGTPKKRTRYPEKTYTLAFLKHTLTLIAPRGTAFHENLRKVL